MKTQISILLQSLFALLMFIPVSIIHAQASLQIDASRLSGVAPMHVFFDATATSGLEDGNDLVNSDFSWNFDDNQGNFNQTKGMVVGHVFEQPGLYQVSCTLIAADGSTDTELIQIQVNAFEGETFYVSEDGDDANDGISPGTAWRTANYGFSQLEGNHRLLFRRGDTFPNVEGQILNQSNGPMIIGAYGEGEKPIFDILLDGDQIETILEINNSQDVKIMDLHLRAVSHTYSRCLSISNGSSHVLVSRLELEQSSGQAIFHRWSQLTAISECQFYNFGVLALYSGDCNRLSFIGNSINNLIGTPQPEHGVRIQGGEKQFIAHNSFTNLINSKTALTVRGDQQRHVMIYKNKMDRLLGVNPQNHNTYAHISHITIEGNYIGQNPDYNGTDWSNSTNGINIEATNVAVRNNVIDGYRNAIMVNHDYSGPPSGMVDIYHNTANWRPVSPESSTGGILVLVRDVSDVNVVNNLLTAAESSQSQLVAYGELAGGNFNILDSNNLLIHSPTYELNPLPNSSADQNDISNYVILQNSAANNAGISGFPVYFDALSAERNSVAPDVGALERLDYSTPPEGELTSFSAYINGNHTVDIEWTYSCETLIGQYVVQRSSNRKDWEQVSKHNAKQSCEESRYSFEDEDPIQGKSYYRLAIHHNNGDIVFSELKKVFVFAQEGWDIYPNPINDHVLVEYPDDGKIKYLHVRLFNESGKPVFYAKTLANSPARVDLPNLPIGSYIVYVIRGKYKYYEVVEKF